MIRVVIRLLLRMGRRSCDGCGNRGFVLLTFVLLLSGVAEDGNRVRVMPRI